MHSGYRNEIIGEESLKFLTTSNDNKPNLLNIIDLLINDILKNVTENPIKKPGIILEREEKLNLSHTLQKIAMIYLDTV